MPLPLNILPLPLPRPLAATRSATPDFLPIRPRNGSLTL
jgi:hypothetical protein